MRIPSRTGCLLFVWMRWQSEQREGETLGPLGPESREKRGKTTTGPIGCDDAGVIEVGTSFHNQSPTMEKKIRQNKHQLLRVYSCWCERESWRVFECVDLALSESMRVLTVRLCIHFSLHFWQNDSSWRWNWDWVWNRRARESSETGILSFAECASIAPAFLAIWPAMFAVGKISRMNKWQLQRDSTSSLATSRLP